MINLHMQSVGMMERFDALVAVALAIRAREKHEAAAASEEKHEEAAAEEKHEAAAASSSRFTTRPKKRKRAARFSGQPKRNKCNSVQIQNRGNGGLVQPLAEELKNAIQEVARGGNVTPAALVIQKKLFKTDVSPEHYRLSIPVNQIRNDFLRVEEKRDLRKQKAIGVKIIEPSLELNDVKLKQWVMETTYNYVIVGTSWNDIVKKNGLEAGMEVQLWSFRLDHLLYFALVRL